jgi:hypothetical protein
MNAASVAGSTGFPGPKPNQLAQPEYAGRRFHPYPRRSSKRINLTRENELHNGTIAERITHIAVETRLIGRAQLFIVERPTSEETAARGVGEGGQ